MKPARIVIVIAILAVAYLAASPYLTVHRMKAAADARDGQALAAFVDFPSVRQGLKDQMNAVMAREIPKTSSDNAFAVTGAAMAGLMLDKMVDAFISPEGLVGMMRAEQNAVSSTPEKGSRSNVDTSMRYESLNRFLVTVTPVDGSEHVRLRLRRDGLGWKLSEILLPEETLKGSP